MTAYKVTVVERPELSEITIVCDGCGTAVVVQIVTANFPKGCPSCGKAYTEETDTALAALARFHREAEKAEKRAGKQLFHFAIKEPDKM